MCHQLGLPWLLQDSGISPEVGAQALERMRWYFDQYGTALWAAYDWQRDMFHEERRPRPLSEGSPQPSAEWGTIEGFGRQAVPSSAKRRRTEDGWVAAVASAHREPGPSVPSSRRDQEQPAQEISAIAVPEPRSCPPERVYPQLSSVQAPTTQGDRLQSPGPSAAKPTPSAAMALVPLKEFRAFQDACRDQRVPVPQSVSEALNTAAGALRKAALYEWLTKAVGSFRESLETQVGLMCVQATSLLTQQLDVAKRAETTGSATPGAGNPPEVTEAQLNEGAAVLRNRWRRHLAPAVNYPTGDPIQEAIAARQPEAGPTGAARNRRLDVDVIDLDPPSTE